MAAKQTSVKTSTINRAVQAPSAPLERYGRGLDDWPRAWMGLEKDLLPLKAAVEEALQRMEGWTGQDDN
jgi:hypothetical protein